MPIIPHNCDHCSDNRGVTERLARIEAIVERIDHQLLGNHQPGMIQKLEERIDEQEERITVIEGWRNKMYGVAAGIGTAAGFVGRLVWK